MAASTAIKAILGGLRGRRLGHDVAGRVLQRARNVEHFIKVACLHFSHRTWLVSVSPQVSGLFKWAEPLGAKRSRRPGTDANAVLT